MESAAPLVGAAGATGCAAAGGVGDAGCSSGAGVPDTGVGDAESGGPHNGVAVELAEAGASESVVSAGGVAGEGAPGVRAGIGALTGGGGDIGCASGSGIALVGSDPHPDGPESADGRVIGAVGSSLPVSTGSVMSSVGSSVAGPVCGGRSSRCVVSASAAGLGDGLGRGRDGGEVAGRVRASSSDEPEVASRTGQTIAVVSSAGDLRGTEGAGGVAGGVLVDRSDWGESGAGEFGSDMLVSGPFAMAYTRKSRGPDATASESRPCLLPEGGGQCGALRAARVPMFAMMPMTLRTIKTMDTRSAAVGGPVGIALFLRSVRGTVRQLRQ